MRWEQPSQCCSSRTRPNAAEISCAHSLRWEEHLSRFLPDSELLYLNRNACIPVHVGPLLFNVLETALAAARATNGLYDPTLLSQLLDMGYDRTFEDMPATQPATTGSAIPGGAWRLIRVNREMREVTLPPGIGLDFGGIAKGMAVDAAMDHLREIEITTALFNAGGDLAAMGTPPADDHWPAGKRRWKLDNCGLVADRHYERTCIIA